MSDIIEFKGTILKQRYNSENYKIYVVDIDKKIYKNIKSNNNDEYIIVGDIPSLVPNVEYEIKAQIEKNKKYGVQYKVSSVKKDKPTDIESSKNFLQEVLTERQANILLNAYPDIIDRIIKNKEIDLTKTSGIKENTFSIIKRKVIENFALIDLIDKYGGYIPMSAIKKLYDKYHNINSINKSLQENPYKCLCSLSRIGFKKADDIVLALEEYSKNSNKKDIFFKEPDIRKSKQRLISCIDYILGQNESSGNTKIEIKKLRKECGLVTPECINHFVDVLKDKNNNFIINNEDKSITSKEAWFTEEYISKCIDRFLHNENEWLINTDLYKKDGLLELTNEQMGVLDNLCRYNISLLTAPAGSGKSQSIKNVINMLEDNDKTFLLMTPTGKSSKVLSDYTGKESGTIHRQLKYNPRNDNPWTYNEENKLDVDVVIVDEFSMVDIYLFKHLLEAINIGKTKLLLVFDSFQLPSVGCGNVSQDLLDYEKMPRTVLTKIFRYNEGGLAQIATKARKGEKYLDNNFQGVKIFGTKKDFIYMELQQENMINNIIKIYKKLLKDGCLISDIMILTAQNKGNYGTVNINKYIQKLIQQHKQNKFIMRGEDKFYKGDKVIQITNNYKALNDFGDETEIFNGSTGIVSDVQYNKILVEYDDRVIQYSKEDLNQIELGYCITIHKSQGSSAKQVITIMPKAHNYMLNSNLIYTGWTRAKERVYCLANIVTINRRLKVKENLKRETNLLKFLKQVQ